MASFQIVSSAGVVFGVYQGATAAEAIDAMARDAGYASEADTVARGIEPFDGVVREVQTYTVRPLGGTAWEERIVSLDAAHESAREARDRGLRNVVIVDDATGAVVDEDA